MDRTLGIRWCVIALLTFALWGCGDKATDTATQAPQEVSVYKITLQDVPLSAEFVGQTKGAVDADVRARVEGVITAIHFKEGSQVKEGDLLYEIDPEPFQAKVAEAEAKVAEAQTKLVRADADLKRIRPLAEMNAVSKRDLDAAIASEGVARTGVDAAKASLEAAKIELGYCKITAPVSGLIGLTKARVGEFVGKPPNAVVLNTVSQLDPIHVRFTVTEKDYLYFARIKQKQEAAGIAAPPRALELVLADGSVHGETGKLASVDSQIDPSTGSLTAEASFPNPGFLLRPGQFAKIRTIKETITGAVLLPKKSIRELQGLMQVAFVAPDQTVSMKTVTLGAELGGNVVVTEGLAADDLVVAEPQGRLAPGTKIVPKVIDLPK